MAKPIMIKPTNKRKPSQDRYFQRVQDFPLVPIRDDRHLTRALTIIKKMLEEKLDATEEEYLDVLSSLVEDYEEIHHDIPDADEAAVLIHLLESHSTTLRQVAMETGIDLQTLAKVQKRKLSLSKENIGALSEYFQVSPSVFFAG